MPDSPETTPDPARIAAGLTWGQSTFLALFSTPHTVLQHLTRHERQTCREMMVKGLVLRIGQTGEAVVLTLLGRAVCSALAAQETANAR